jgi:hypothetical protein
MLDRYGEGRYALVMIRGSLAIGYAAIVVAAVLWGGSIVAQKVALSGFSAVEASVLRDLGGLVILIITWCWQGGSLALLTSRDYRTLALLGLGVLGNHLLILIGLKYVSGAVAGVIIGSLPVVTALLSALFIQDVPLRAVWAGSLLSFSEWDWCPWLVSVPQENSRSWAGRSCFSGSRVGRCIRSAAGPSWTASRLSP